MRADATLLDLSPAHQAQYLARLARGGIRGAEGDEGHAADHVADLTALHELLSVDDRRAVLSDAELGQFAENCSALWALVRAGEVEGVDAHDTAVLRSVGECLVALAAESAARYAAAAEAMTSIEEIAAMAGLSDTSAEAESDAADDDAGSGDDAPDDAPDDASGEAGAESTDDAEGIQAGAGGGERLPVPGAAELARRTPRARRTAPAVHVGAERGELTWLPTGESISLAEYFSRLSTYDGRFPMDEKVRLGRIGTLDENAVRINSRQDSPEEVSRKLELAVARLLDPRSWDEHGRPREPITASGGWGTPSPIVYDVDTIAVADRPVRSALPSVGVDRGGLTWIRQPTLAQITTGGPGVTTAAVGVWTPADDASATDGNPVKSHMRISDPTTVTVQLDALYMSLELGVLQSRAFPEWIAAWQRNTDAAYARMAETYLLDKIEDSTLTKFVSQAIVLGAARDYLAFLISLTAQERNRQRMRPDAMVRCLYPAWLEDLVTIDLLRSGTVNTNGTPQVSPRSWIQGQLRAANINGSPYFDSSTHGHQLLPSQADEDDLNELPTTVRSYIFPEGTFVVGDGGMLDVGVIRDSSLVESNDFRTFSESFEAVFDRGHWAYCLDTDLCPSGTSSAAVDVQHLCTTGS